MVDADRTVVVVTEEASRWWAYSPDIPGFSFGAPTKTEFWLDVHAAVAWAGGKPDLIVYKQLPYETPEGVEWLLRVPQDEHMDDRLTIAQWVHAAIMHTDQRLSMFEHATPTKTGEFVFHCALFTDTIASVLRALRPADDTVVITAAAAERLFYAQEMARGVPDQGSVTLNEMGLEAESTIQELMIAEGVRPDRPEGLRLGRRLEIV